MKAWSFVSLSPKQRNGSRCCATRACRSGGSRHAHGLEEDLHTGIINPGQVPNENEALAIARHVPGINVILMGHTHRDVPSLMVNGVLLTQADYWGKHVARVDLYFDKDQKGRWLLAAETARTITVDDKVEPDAEALKAGRTIRSRNGSLVDSRDRRMQRRVVAREPAFVIQRFWISFSVRNGSRQGRRFHGRKL